MGYIYSLYPESTAHDGRLSSMKAVSRHHLVVGEFYSSSHVDSIKGPPIFVMSDRCRFYHPWCPTEAKHSTKISAQRYPFHIPGQGVPIFPAPAVNAVWAIDPLVDKALEVLVLAIEVVVDDELAFRVALGAAPGMAITGVLSAPV